MPKNLVWTMLIILAMVPLALSGCGAEAPAAVPEPVTAEEPTVITEPTAAARESPLPTPDTNESPSGAAAESPLPTPLPEAGEIQTLSIALLPVLDVLPFHVAEQNGYFDQVGLAVEPVPVKSGQERDTLMQTGQVDGALTDLLTPVLFDQNENLVKTVRTARKAYADSPMFYLLAAQGSEVASPQDLAGVEIGIAQNTVIEYLTDRMLENAGLTPDQIAIQEVSAIPVRFELLINGQLPAATLPDPLASGAMAAGAVLVIDDTSVHELSQSILVFGTETLETKPEAVRRFLQAWEMAVEDLNSSPEAYQTLLIEKGRVPESIQGTFQMPPFPEASVPTQEQLADVIQWAMDKGLIQNDVPFEWMVDDSYLP